MWYAVICVLKGYILYVHIHKIYLEKCEEKWGKLLIQRKGILDSKVQKWKGNSLFFLDILCYSLKVYTSVTPISSLRAGLTDHIIFLFVIPRWV